MLLAVRAGEQAPTGPGRDPEHHLGGPAHQAQAPGDGSALRRLAGRAGRVQRRRAGGPDLPGYRLGSRCAGSPRRSTSPSRPLSTGLACRCHWCCCACAGSPPLSACWPRSCSRWLAPTSCTTAASGAVRLLALRLCGRDGRPVRLSRASARPAAPDLAHLGADRSRGRLRRRRLERLRVLDRSGPSDGRAVPGLREAQLTGMPVAGASGRSRRRSDRGLDRVPIRARPAGAALVRDPALRPADHLDHLSLLQQPAVPSPFLPTSRRSLPPASVYALPADPGDLAGTGSSQLRLAIYDTRQSRIDI